MTEPAQRAPAIVAEALNGGLASAACCMRRGFDEPFLRHFKFVRDGASACGLLGGAASCHSPMKYALPVLLKSKRIVSLRISMALCFAW